MMSTALVPAATPAAGGGSPATAHLDIRGELDVEAFVTAYDAVVDARGVDDACRPSATLAIIDLSAEDDPADRAARWMATEGCAPIAEPQRTPAQDVLLVLGKARWIWHRAWNPEAACTVAWRQLPRLVARAYARCQGPAAHDPWMLEHRRPIPNDVVRGLTNTASSSPAVVAAALVAVYLSRVTGAAELDVVPDGQQAAAGRCPERCVALDVGGDPLTDKLAFRVDDLLGGSIAGASRLGTSTIALAADGLGVMICEVEGCPVEVVVHARVDRVEVDDLERHASRVLRILDRHGGDHPLRGSELNVLEAGERRWLLEDLNRSGVPFPSDRCLHELVLEQVERSPDSVAVVAPDGSLTYRELERASAALASSLQARGVGPDVPVVVWMDRSAALVVTLLGILRAGGGYVPVDPDVPPTRLSQLVGEASAPVVATAAGWSPKAPDLQDLIIEVDLDVLGDGEPVDLGTAPENLVSIYFTSGSTGTPKGVANHHRGWVNRMWWNQLYHELRPGEAVLQKTILSFDDAAVEVFWPLMYGGRVVLLAPGLHRDPRAILDAVAEHGVAVLQTVPSMLALLLDEAQTDEVGALGALRQVVSTGEALHPELVARFRSVLGVIGCGLNNTWGGSEASIDSTVHRCETGDGLGREVPIGDPIANNQVYVLDQHLEPVPVGLPGDLYLGGVGLARGYWQDPRRTAEVFIPHPFRAGERLYRTGDQGQRRADGKLVFLGRADHQVKVRGIRIEPGEIEYALRNDDAVADAVVVKWEPTPGDVRLAAYVVPATHDIGLDDVAARLGVGLPPYMVPAVFTTIDEIPYTPSGKVDRARLPVPRAREREQVVEPRTDAEHLVAELWRDVLDVPAVDLDDDFFAIGGHSLLATKIVSRLRRRLDRDIPLSLLFDNPTISGMAAALDRSAPRDDTGPARIPGDISPLSFGQVGLWFLEQLDPGRSDYNMAAAMRLRGRLDVDALTEAIQQVVECHHILRSQIVSEDGEPWLHDRPALVIPLERTHLAHLKPGDAASAASRIVREEAAAPFDLAEGPLLRVHLLQVQPDEHILSVVMHHLATDAWSVGLFWEEVSTAYRQILDGEFPRSPGERLQYRDFAWWQRQRLTEERIESMLVDWRRALAGASATEVPSDWHRLPRPSGAGGRVERAIPANVSSRIRELARDQRVTLFMVALAALDVVLKRHSGNDDIVIGTPVAGRVRPELEDLVGYFVNTVVLRVDTSGEPSFLELLDRVRAALLVSFEHQELPFERVVAALSPDRDAARNPFFQITFSLNTDPDAAFDLPGLEVDVLEVGHQTARFDLEFDVRDRGEDIVAGVVYSADLYERELAEDLVGHLVHVLEQVVADPFVSIGDLAAPGVAGDSAATPATVHAAPHDLEASACVHDLIAAQVALRPDDTALCWREVVLTYRSLDAHANRLAHELVHAGVGPDRAVAVLLDRTPAMLVAVLATLKAGGAYVPIDPTYPSDRIALMLQESKPTCVLVGPGGTETVSAVDAAVVEVDPEHLLEACDAEAPDVAVDPDHLAYVIFTSGSTGAPKGVMVPHRGLVNVCQDMAARFDIDPKDVVAAITTVSFDIAFVELLVPLAHGAKIALVDRDVTQDVSRLATEVREREVSVMFATPPTWNLLIENGWEGGPIRAITGGDVLQPAAADALRSRVDQLTNLYGPTETTIYSTSAVVDDQPRQRSVPVGRAISNTDVGVFDEALRPVPRGAVGEVIIGGLGVARGYAGAPRQTATRFVPSPFASGERAYRTGDVARVRADGNLEFLGRNDHQVKIRGFRIELGEIEARLAAHPSVTQAVVSAWPDPTGHKRLVAHVASGVSATVLRAHVADVLPDHMVPAHVVTMDALPLTDNGKIDRSALPAPDLSTDRAARVVPQTPTEQVIAHAWREVLGITGLGVHDDFFESGGDSILSMKVTAALRRVGVPSTPRLILEHPTVAALARALDRGPTRTEVHTEQEPVTGAVDMTPIQRWFTGLRWPHDHFNQSVRLRWSAPVSIAALRSALERVVAHHDALRLRLARDSRGEWHQWTAATDDDDLIWVAPPGEGGLAVEQILDRAQESLDLARGPIVRAVVLSGDGDGGDDVVIVVHHIAIDDVSWGIVLEDLALAYEQVQSDAAVALPPKTTSFQHWASRLTEYASSGVVDVEAGFWSELLSGRYRSDGGSQASSRTISCSLDRSATTGLLREAHAGHGTQAIDLLVAALAQTMAAWSGAQLVHVVLEGHGRELLFDDVDLTRTVGWFTSMHPVVIPVPDGADDGRMIGIVREHLRTTPLRGIGYGLTQHLRKDAPATVAAPVSFNYHSQQGNTAPGGLFDECSEPSGRALAPAGIRPFPFEVNAVVSDGTLRVDWTYSAESYAATEIEQLADGYVQRLAALVEHGVRHAAATSADAVRFVDRLHRGVPSLELARHRHHVAGASVALLRDGSVSECWGAGHLGDDTARAVDSQTVFQAGSTSKLVAAFATLCLVGQGVLQLDRDVWEVLRSWTPPEEQHDAVTVRQLMSHTAGLTVNAFAGYERGSSIPDLGQVLRGEVPATSGAISCDQVAPAAFRYSGSHYVVLQQVLEDVTGVPFPSLAGDLVFAPLDMLDSGYGEAFLSGRQANVAHGHDRDGRPIPGGWRAHPEAANGGLWTTAGDLARVIAEIRRAHLGVSTLLPRELAEAMLTPVESAAYGLGVVVRAADGDTWFGHPGEMAGFRCYAAGTLGTGDGIVFLASGEGGLDAIGEVLAERGVAPHVVVDAPSTPTT